MRQIDEIIIHCSATPEGRRVTVAEIDRWHRERGFRSIGYHYVVYIDGSVHEGRPVDQAGAHCSGHNGRSIGICYVGGTDGRGIPKDTRTNAQREALKKLIRQLKCRFPGATVHGHNELTCKRAQSGARSGYAECSRQCAECVFAAKACPSFNVKTDPDLCDL